MRTRLIVLLVVVLLAVSACDKIATRTFGGTTTVKLKANRKLITMTWKDTDLWILTRKSRPGEFSEEYDFAEDSNFGLMEGTVIVIENILPK